MLEDFIFLAIINLVLLIVWNKAVKYTVCKNVSDKPNWIQKNSFKLNAFIPR